jgi:hypothetical protein
MPLTPRQLNRATLARQLLAERQPLQVVDTVRHVVGLQAQEPASPYVALWNRVADFDPTQLDAAFANHDVVKAPLMRITLHAVGSEDYTTFHEAMLETLRDSRLNDRRFAQTGLSIDDADELIAPLVDFTDQARSKDEIEEFITERLGFMPAEPGVWWALRTFAPLLHAPSGGPWSFGSRPSYVAAPAEPSRDDRALSTREMIRRYLAAFGPASVRDFAQFALLRQSTIKPAFAALAEELVTVEGPDGVVLYDLPDAPVPHGDAPVPPRLMAMWDSVLLAYADRSRIIPEEYRKTVIRNNGDVLPTLLVDGYVSGVWRPVDGGIEVTAFRSLSHDAWEGIAVEASSLLELLADRDPRVYSRYGRWWSNLAGAEVQVLAG